MPSSQGFPKLRTAAVVLVLVLAAVSAPCGVEARQFPHKASGAAQEGTVSAESAVSDTIVEPQHATRRLHGAAPPRARRDVYVYSWTSS